MSAVSKSQERNQHSRLGQGWCMPRTIRRFGEKLLAQQLWCWGQDIANLDGNLLMRFGFARHRDSETDARSTCYRLDQDDLHVALWGFGMFFGQRDLGGLYLGRFEFCPDWAPIESISLSIHWPDELPIFDRPYGPDQWLRARKLWESLLLWIADYERWILKTSSIEYRNECVESWLRPIVRASCMPDAWQFLSFRGWENNNHSIQQALKKYTL